MDNNSLFLVEKEDFKSLVERLKFDKIRTEKIEETLSTTVKIYGIDSDNCICSHKWYNDDAIPDEYYIFKLPTSEEWGPAVPKLKVELNEEESEMLFKEIVNALKEKKNESSNDQW